jgi:hypothetical protein
MTEMLHRFRNSGQEMPSVQKIVVEKWIANGNANPIGSGEAKPLDAMKWKQTGDLRRVTAKTWKSALAGIAPGHADSSKA